MWWGGGVTGSESEPHIKERLLSVRVAGSLTFAVVSLVLTPVPSMGIITTGERGKGEEEGGRGRGRGRERRRGGEVCEKS